MSSSSSTPDPTGGTNEQLAAKEAATSLGDMDAENLAPARTYPPGADTPTAQNVRRYPELFSDDVIASFDVEDTSEPPEVVTDVDVALDKGQSYDTDTDTDTSSSTHVSY